MLAYRTFQPSQIVVLFDWHDGKGNPLDAACVAVRHRSPSFVITSHAAPLSTVAGRRLACTRRFLALSCQTRGGAGGAGSRQDASWVARAELTNQVGSCRRHCMLMPRHENVSFLIFACCGRICRLLGCVRSKTFSPRSGMLRLLQHYRQKRRWLAQRAPGASRAASNDDRNRSSGSKSPARVRMTSSKRALYLAASPLRTQHQHNMPCGFLRVVDWSVILIDLRNALGYTGGASRGHQNQRPACPFWARSGSRRTLFNHLVDLTKQRAGHSDA